jgi:hypothetical protein
LIVVAEAHRDEFRAVADYLNALAEHDAELGIVVWLVEARAVRIGDSPWAPLFTAVAAPNNFTRSVEQARQTRPNLESFDAFLALATPDVGDASRDLVRLWEAEGHQIRLGPKHATRSSGSSPICEMASHPSKTSRPLDR